MTRKLLTNKMALGVLMIALAIAMLGVGTFAYFSDSETSSANVFSTGTIDLILSNDLVNWGQAGYGDSVTATWSSPANWAPGDIVDATVHVKNTGSIDVNSLLTKITLTNALTGCTANVNCGLADMIDMLEYNDDTSVGSGVGFVTYFKTKYDTGGPGDALTPDGHLSLAEWDNAHRDPPADAYDTSWYCDGSEPAPGNLPCVLANGVTTDRGTPANPYFFIHIKWQLRADAGNAYQGQTATMKLKINGQQTWAPGDPGWPAENV
ncbi:camelysin metallo-endopeptidase [bacterium BMS3Abin01]|nr:camelysin metallo-endopeptidase [bacterium BMS3Abin01]